MFSVKGGTGGSTDDDNVFIDKSKQKAKSFICENKKNEFNFIHLTMKMDKNESKVCFQAKIRFIAVILTGDWQKVAKSGKISLMTAKRPNKRFAFPSIKNLQIFEQNLTRASLFKAVFVAGGELY